MYYLKQIPNDIVSGYMGTDEYDYNGYLTRLLIVKLNLILCDMT